MNPYCCYMLFALICLFRFFCSATDAVSQSEICLQPPDLCIEFKSPWWYDSVEQECKQMEECTTVTNRFATKDACSKQCDEKCSQPPESCFDPELPWHYDTVHKACLQYKIGGCNETGNRFATEEECYKQCYEKIVQLHPPQNVSVGFTETNRIFIFWYPPVNYKLHEQIDDTSSSHSTAVSGDKNNTAGLVSASGDLLTTTPKVDLKPDINVNVSGTTNMNKTATDSAHNMTDTSNDTKAESTTKTPSPQGGTNLSVEEFVGKEFVPFHLGVLVKYIVTIQLSDGTFVKNLTVDVNETEVTIKDLKEKTEHIVIVSAVYLSNTTMSAPLLKVTTRQSSNCYCDPYGTDGGYKECNHSVTAHPWCKCKPGFAGLFCEICQYGRYRLAPSMPCHACPCPKTFSTGTCRFVEGYLHCSTCRKGYTGNLCHRCANGFYRDHASAPSQCIPCTGCENSDPGLICDPFTGKCGSCHYNTTGDKCDRCLDGFHGDPLNNKPCVPIGEVESHSFKPPATGVIAAVVIGTIVLLSGVVGFIVYRRMHNFPKNRPFWTIEFKEDHEDVNFSAVPEDEIERQVEDLKFKESQSKNKSKHPYSHLQEEF